MALTQCVPNNVKKQFLGFGAGDISWSSALYWTIALVDSTSNAGPDTTTFAGVTGEITGTGYAAGGKALTASTLMNATAGFDSTTNTYMMDFSDVSWTNASFTAAGAVIYQNTGDKYVAAVLNFGSDKTVTNGTFTIKFPTLAANSAIIRVG